MNLNNKEQIMFIDWCRRCNGKLIFLKNSKTGNYEKLNYDSLTTQEKIAFHTGNEDEIMYNEAHHVKHEHQLVGHFHKHKNPEEK